MKKRLILAALLVAALLTLCGCKKAQVQTDTETGDQKFSGTVTKLENAQLSVISDGVTLTFKISGANLSQAKGLATNDWVDVYFTGKLKGSSAENTTVTRVVREKKATNPTPTDNTDKVISGQVTNVTNGGVTLLVSEKLSLTFDTRGAKQTEIKDGIAVGDTLSVIYSGQINGTDTAQAKVSALRTVKKAVPPADKESEKKPKPEPPKKEELLEITGTVQDVNLNNLVIRTDKKQILAFSVTGLTLPKMDHEDEQYKVKITYTGRIVDTDTTAAKVKKVVLI